MRTCFRKLHKNNECAHQLNIVGSLRERVIGLHSYSWTSNRFALVFRTPCILHSLFLKKNIRLILLNRDLEPTNESFSMAPNSVMYCFVKGQWIAELSEENDPGKIEFDGNDESRNREHTDQKPSAHVIPEKSVRRILFNFGFILSLLLVGTLCYAGEKQSIVKLQVGESKEVALQDAPRSLDISQPDVIDVQRIGSSNRILITAIKSGTSNLTARFPESQPRTWSFQVGVSAGIPSTNISLSSASMLRTAREIQKRVGLDVTVDNGRIALFGTVQNEQQVKSLLEICLNREECLPRFTLTDNAALALARQFQQHIIQLEFKNVIVEVNLGSLILKGSVAYENQVEILMNLAQSIAPRVHHQLAVERASQPLVESQLSFYRISQTGLSALGIATSDPQSQSASSGFAKLSTAEHVAKLKGGPLLTLSLPDLLLKALSQKGVVQQIAQPSIVVASGGKGEILSGGELLFQSGGQVQKFHSQSYGISVVLQPRILGHDRIAQKIELKITHPQHDPTQKSISSMNSSILNTEVSSRFNEVLLLTRISQKANGKSIQKIPLLGHVPILGELFKSREVSGEDAELWITLRSNVVLSQAPALPKEELVPIDASPHPHWLD